MKVEEFSKLYNRNLQANSNYIEVDNLLTEKDALNYVLDLKKDKYLNAGVFDLVNYEKLIYIYINFNSNNEIMSAINDIFNAISACYIEKEKYKKKLL